MTIGHGRSSDTFLSTLASSPGLVALGCLSLPITYYAYTETFRYFHLRSRQQAWDAYHAGRTSHLSLRDAVQARFAVLKCWLTGRYLNVTWEWREQSILEFMFHHLVQKPLTGKLWWKGGYDEQRHGKELDWQEVDTTLLVKGVGKKKSRSGSSTPASTKSSEEGWEAVEASTSQIAGKQEVETEAEEESIAVTWLGQSTCIVQLEGLTILTDPCFSPQPIETPFAPTRLKPIPLSLSPLCSLQLVDLILVSHNHFDHLDVNCIRDLNASSAPTWVVPSGVKALMLSYGTPEEKIVEMAWWEERELLGLRIAATPAQHWSGRNPWDSNRSLWCGFVVKSLQNERMSFFHAGDTGYSEELYSSIGRMHAPVTLGLIPIGAYHPRWMMAPVHTDPQGALAIHRHLGIRESIAVHWGTWLMSDEEWWEPRATLDKERKDESFGTVGLGERRVVKVSKA